MITTAPPAAPAAPLRVGLVRAGESAAWDRFAAEQPTGHLLQAWEWGTFKGEQGWTPARLAVRAPDSGRILAGAQVLFRAPRPGIPLRVAYVPRGPLLALDDLTAAGAALLAGLHAYCRRHQAVFLKIEPDLPASPRAVRTLQAAGFRPAQRVQPQRSITLDLRPEAPEETLLAAMKPKTRYNIRLAQRRGVRVRRAVTLDDVRQFYDLMQVTGARDEFGLHSFDYYRRVWELFPDTAAATERPVAMLLLADHPDGGEAPLAGLLAFAFGDEAIYMYGASADRGREHMPTYLLQWEAMRWARAHGCRRYDFWGIPDAPEAEAPPAEANQNVRQGLWGVYRFKQGFGGQEVEYLGAWDFVYRPWIYALYRRLAV